MEAPADGTNEKGDISPDVTSPAASHQSSGDSPIEEMPRGWSYNPSSWPQRLPIIVTALFNTLLAIYLAVCQLFFHGHAWEPFFGTGTQRVLTSELSPGFPISFAALGAIAYLLSTLCSLFGGDNRWRKMPWLVFAGGALMIPILLVSVWLMIRQPVVVHAWCSLCLVAAGTVFVIFPLAVDEVIASVQFLQQNRDANRSLWHLLWHGGGPQEAQEALNTKSLPEKPFAGVTTPWRLFICHVIGIVLTVIPPMLGGSLAAENNLYVVGTLVIAITCLAFTEVARALRFLLMPCGLWLLVLAPFTLAGTTNTTKFVEMATGAVLIALSYKRGKIYDSYGQWNRYII